MQVQPHVQQDQDAPPSQAVLLALQAQVLPQPEQVRQVLPVQLVVRFQAGPQQVVAQAPPFSLLPLW